jgi:hypothetical protein
MGILGSSFLLEREQGLARVYTHLREKDLRAMLDLK